MTIMTNYKYAPFYLFFIIYLFLEIESFTPISRLAHSSVLVENKLYFFGGVLNDSFCSNEVFYLDVSQTFNIQAPLWNDITPNAGIPFRIGWGTTSLNDINNKQTIYLLGGIIQNIATNDTESVGSFIYSFNLNFLTWDVPTVKGIPPERRRQISSVSDNTGKLYIFGGITGELTGSTATKYFNDMNIFNTVELSWSISKSPITARASYTATLLLNGVIVYIGGYSNNIDIDISQIALYDTKTSTWSNKVCTKIKRLIIAKKQLNLNFNVYTL
jgi:N-acetylneuraminic acid mutarotase